MEFTNGQLSDLLGTPGDDTQQAAEKVNLRIEDRPSPARLTHYETHVGDSADWNDWRGRHNRYVQVEVRRRFPLSAAFTPGEPSLRPTIEANQWLIRVERIDGLLDRYTDTGARADPGMIQSWIAELADATTGSGSSGTSLADLGRLTTGATPITPGTAALGELTEVLNQGRADGRPSFVALDAEFPDLGASSDWADEITERCGLAHLYLDRPATLALFRYRVQEVLDGQPPGQAPATLFAVPTVLDQPFYNAFHPAPGTINCGRALHLGPTASCDNLAKELIHARIDYRPEHWVAVSSLTRPVLSSADIARLRDTHLECLRQRSGETGYGADC